MMNEFNSIIPSSLQALQLGMIDASHHFIITNLVSKINLKKWH